MKDIFKNNMVRIFSLGFMLVGIISVGIFIQSCSNLDDEYSPSDWLDEYEMNAKAANYLIFENDHFYLKLSKDEAFKLGITESYYYKMLSDIENTNVFIHENRMGESVVNSYNEWRKNSNPNFIPRLKNGNENDGGSFWSFPNSSTGTTRSFSYSGGSISFYGNSTCLITVISIYIVCGGTTISTSLTLYPYGNNSKTVNLPYFSGTCSVTVNTTCSDGATLVVK